MVEDTGRKEIGEDPLSPSGKWLSRACQHPRDVDGAIEEVRHLVGRDDRTVPVDEQLSALAFDRAALLYRIALEIHPGPEVQTQDG